MHGPGGPAGHGTGGQGGPQPSAQAGALRALTEDELMNVTPPTYELDGRTQQGGLTLLVAPRGGYKTRKLAAMLGASVTGGECYGAKALRSGPVLAVIAEDLPGWRERWFSWRRAEHIADDQQLPLHTWVEPVNLFNGLGVKDLLAEVARIDPIVIGIDTLADVTTGADENSQRDMGIVRDRLKQLRLGGRSITAVHHTGYDGSRERGSSVLGAMADTIILLKAGEDGHLIMENTKQRNGPLFGSIALGFDPTALVLYRALPTPRKISGQQDVVLKALVRLAGSSPGGVDIADWKKRCVSVEGVKQRTFFDAKKKLIDAGLVTEPVGGKFLPA